ncbi:MAG: cyclic nucleotide-binding domain-containing protein [Candidatus Hydrogenedentes bacterium]|jgi:CRP-like cAMP-binding protein|nr:cyclic nucleotide-binding domain-containing protein [Candidatus Hydrogenedentota bacterium]
MAQEFTLEDLGIPSGSEFHRLVERCGGSRLLRYDDGETLVERGDPSRDAYLILRGGYVVRREESKDSVAEGQVTDPSAPEFVGELVYLGRGRRSASVAALGETFAICLKPEHMDTIMEEFPMFTRILCKQFAVVRSLPDLALRSLKESF